MFKTKYYLLKASIGRNKCAELFVGFFVDGCRKQLHHLVAVF